MPWECKSCQTLVATDSSVACPSCGTAKAAWTLVSDKTRDFVLPKRSFSCLRSAPRFRDPAPREAPGYADAVWVPTKHAFVMAWADAESLARRELLPAPVHLLTVRLVTTTAKSQTVLLNLEYESRRQEEVELDASEAEQTAPGTFDLRLLFVFRPASNLRIRLPIDPNDPLSTDDTFALSSSSDRFETQTKTIADDQGEGDDVTDLLFVGLDPELSYTLEVDPGADAKPYTMFEDVPYRRLAGLPERTPTEDPAGTLRVRVPVDPNDPVSADDRFELASRDPCFQPIVCTVADDQGEGDEFTDLVFTNLDPALSYTLRVDPGEQGRPYLLFEDVAFTELTGAPPEGERPTELPAQDLSAAFPGIHVVELSEETAQQFAPGVEVEALRKKAQRLVTIDQDRAICVRLAVDPDDPVSSDDRFRLFCPAGEFEEQVKTTRDDTTPGDDFTDLFYTGLDPKLSYSLEVDPGQEGEPYLVFEEVPYSELSGEATPKSEATP